MNENNDNFLEFIDNFDYQNLQFEINDIFENHDLNEFMDNVDFQNLQFEMNENFENHDLNEFMDNFEINNCLTEFELDSAAANNSEIINSFKIDSTMKGSSIENNNSFTINATQTLFNKKFNASNFSFDIQMNKTKFSSWNDALSFVNSFINDLHSNLLQKAEESDLVAVSIDNDMFRQPVELPYIRKSQLTSDIIKDSFENVFQSYKIMEENMNAYEDTIYKAHISIIKIPVGSARPKGLKESKKRRSRVFIQLDSQKSFKKKHFNQINNQKRSASTFERKNSLKNNLHHYLQKKKSIITINNSDNYCLIRAVIIAKNIADGLPFEHLLKEDNFEMKTKLQKIIKDLNIPDKPLGIPEISNLEKYFVWYQIMLLDKEGKINEPLYLNTLENHFTKYIYIAHYEKHFYIIQKPHIYFNRSFWCHKCKIGFNDCHHHKCRNTCKSCLRINCIYNKETRFYQKCLSCKCTCFSEICLQLHIQRMCGKIKKCQKCLGNDYKSHVCLNSDNFWCRNCSKQVDSNHQCFVLKEKQKTETKNKKKDDFNGFIFFDYEAYEDSQLKKHVPCLIVARTVCEKCSNIEDSNKWCEADSQKHVFKNNNDFCKWLLSFSNRIAIAHNFKGYDSSFIMEFILDNMWPKDSLPTILNNGTKILSINFRKVCLMNF
jgi:hypothetical protein